MKEIFSYKDLKSYTNKTKNIWLLLYKKGSEKSDCAFQNYLNSEIALNYDLFLYSNVNVVRDIHTEFNINSVPALLEINNGKLVNIYKGCYNPEQFSAIFNSSVFKMNSETLKPVQNIVVYSTPTCTWCNTLKRYFDEHKIKYRDIDVSKDQNAAEAMVRKSGQQGVPQTDINGQIIVGFDREKINRLLNIN